MVNCVYYLLIYFTNTVTYLPANNFHPAENLINLSICLSSCTAIFYRAYYHIYTILIVILRNLSMSSGGILRRCNPEVKSVFLFSRRSNAV